VLLKRTMLPGRSTSLRKNLIVHAALLSFIALSATSCSSVVSHPLGSHRRHSPSPLALRHEATKRVGHSVDGRMILATRKAHPPVDRKGLVVGCIHGNECSGIPIARDLARDPVPKGIDLWVVSDLNPDGHFAATRQNADGVDLNRNFPYRWQPLGPRGSTYNAGPGPLSEPESAFIAKLILDKRPGISIWFHQQENLVDRSGGNVGVERRYAHLVGLPLRRLPRYPGSVTGWENHRLPNSTAFVVELPPGKLGAPRVETFSDAVLRLLQPKSQI
jgi:protein MpaA